MLLWNLVLRLVSVRHLAVGVWWLVLNIHLLVIGLALLETSHFRLHVTWVVVHALACTTYGVDEGASNRLWCRLLLLLNGRIRMQVLRASRRLLLDDLRRMWSASARILSNWYVRYLNVTCVSVVLHRLLASWRALIVHNHLGLQRLVDAVGLAAASNDVWALCILVVEAANDVLRVRHVVCLLLAQRLSTVGSYRPSAWRVCNSCVASASHRSRTMIDNLTLGSPTVNALAHAVEGAAHVYRWVVIIINHTFSVRFARRSQVVLIVSTVASIILWQNWIFQVIMVLNLFHKVVVLWRDGRWVLTLVWTAMDATRLDSATLCTHTRGLSHGIPTARLIHCLHIFGNNIVFTLAGAATIIVMDHAAVVCVDLLVYTAAVLKVHGVLILSRSSSLLSFLRHRSGADITVETAIGILLAAWVAIEPTAHVVETNLALVALVWAILLRAWQILSLLFVELLWGCLVLAVVANAIHGTGLGWSLSLPVCHYVARGGSHCAGALQWLIIIEVIIKLNWLVHWLF